MTTKRHLIRSTYATMSPITDPRHRDRDEEGHRVDVGRVARRPVEEAEGLDVGPARNDDNGEERHDGQRADQEERKKTDCEAS